MQHIYMCSSIKIKDYEDFLQKTGLEEEAIVFAGDDIPDYEVMRCVGLPIAPATGRRSEERRVGKECRSRWSPYH